MYGHSEHAVFATRCKESSFYHALPQYGYTELIDEDGNPVTSEGKIGEIVGTSFTNTVSPLIRYRTGDYAVYTNKKCLCGRNYDSWEKIQGREQHQAIPKNGRHISVGPELLCTLHDKSYGKIKQFQIEQKKPGELIIYISTHYKKDFENAKVYFNKFFNEQFPGMFDINVVHRSDSKTLKSTEKHLYFIQHVKN